MTSQSASTALARDKAPNDTVFTVGSAASPAGDDKVPEIIYKVMEKATASLNEMDAAEALTSREFRVHDPDYVLVCQSLDPASGEPEFPVLACGMGPYVNTPYAFALYWREGDSWRGQLYPQAPPEAAKLRRDYFGALGENCPIGCGAVFKALRLKERKLLVAVDLSGAGTRPNQEAHLLELAGDTWRVLWVPMPGEYRFSGNPRVVLPEEGIDGFEVHYADGTKTMWMRQETTFVPK